MFAAQATELRPSISLALMRLFTAYIEFNLMQQGKALALNQPTRHNSAI